MTTESTLAHYAKVAPFYGEFWGDGPEGSYPANRIRWDFVRDRLRQTDAHTVLEAGCGEGSPLAVLRGEGYDTYGFDFSPEMVAEAHKKLPTGTVWVGDITNRRDYAYGLGIPIRFDAVIALGPFPHLDDASQANSLANLSAVTKERGRVYVELRNQTFAWFTQNRLSSALFHDVMDDTRIPMAIHMLIEKRLNMDVPPVHTDTGNYGSTFSRFNELNGIPAMFAKAGLRVEQILTYHHHAFPPQFEARDPKTFRELSLELEWPAPSCIWPANPWGVGAHPDAWKGLYRASAVVVEATKLP